MRASGEIEEVEEGEDGTVRGTDDGYGCWLRAGQFRNEVGRFEDGIEV